ILIVLTSTFTDFSEYFIERTPNEWNELDFLNWLNERDDKLFCTNIPLKDRKTRWHGRLKKALENVRSRCKSYLEQATTNDRDHLKSFATTALRSSTNLHENLEVQAQDISVAIPLQRHGSVRMVSRLGHVVCCNRTGRYRKLGFRTSPVTIPLQRHGSVRMTKIPSNVSEWWEHVTAQMELKNSKEREKLVMFKDSMSQVEWTAIRNERTRKRFLEVDALSENDLKYDKNTSKKIRQDINELLPTSQNVVAVFFHYVFISPLMRYNILDTTNSSATEARKLFKEHWNNIIKTIEDFLSFRPYIPNSAFTSSQDTEQDGQAEGVKRYLKNITKNVNTMNKLCNTIKTEREKLRANGNIRWKKQVLQLMKIFRKQFLNGRNRLKENQTEGNYITKFISHIFTILFEDKSFLECSWGESTLRCSAFLLKRSLRDDDRRCSGNKIDAIVSMVDMDFLEFSTLEVSGPPSSLDHTHYVGDRNKTAKMLKIILNYIKIKYPGDFEIFRRIKVYGIQIYVLLSNNYTFDIHEVTKDMIISSAESILIYIDNSTSESSEEDSKIDE
ncbi:4531_t:CDS:10, partial [Diversispora eburnea]